MKRIFAFILLALLGVMLSNFLVAVSQTAPIVGDIRGEIPWVVYIYWPFVVVLLPFGCLLPLLFTVLHRYQIRPERIISFVVLHFTILLLFSLTEISFHMIFSPDHKEMYSSDLIRLLRGTLDYIGYNFGLYIFTIAAFQSFTYFQQLKDRQLNESRLSEALYLSELNSMKMKLQPHFLFNALQSINSMVLHGKADLASEMISNLSIVLRQSIDSSDDQFTTLDQELKILDHYLNIESIRYEDRVTIKKRIMHSLGDALIPSLLLQPILENAFKHGVAKQIKPVVITINIDFLEDTLLLSVSNTGPKLSADWSLEEASVGLSTTLRRLELLYENNFSFELFNVDSGVLCSIKIPLKREAGE